MSDSVTIQSQQLSATITLAGSELVSLKDSAGREYMSDGNPSFWSRRAPLLFPIVGELQGGRFLHEGRQYPLPRHGFARQSDFALLDKSDDRVRLCLADNLQTREVYPFAFELDMTFHVEQTTLRTCATVRNTGDAPLPFSFGYHPAFAWPLPGGGMKEGHEIVFANDEPGPIRRLDEAGLIARSEPSPVLDRVLTLDERLFSDDAMIWDELASRSVLYRAPAGPELEVAFPEMPYLGIWQMPGANYVCIEPWAGLADDAGYTGEFGEKRGIMTLEPQAERHFAMDVTVRHG